MGEPVASPATGTLILSQSNNAAAGTNRELFNSHQLMLCHQVLLCAFPILILCISRIAFAFIFIAQMVKNRRGGGAATINPDIYTRLLNWGSVRDAIFYFHTQQRSTDSPYLPLSISVHTEMFGVYLHVLYMFMGVCMYTHRCRHHWVSTSA